MPVLLRMFSPPSSYSMLSIERMTAVLLETGDFSDVASLRAQAVAIYSAGAPISPGLGLPAGRQPTVDELRAASDRLFRTTPRRRPLSRDQRDAWRFLEATAGWAYFAETSFDGSIKIGKSEDPPARMLQVSYHAGDHVRLLLTLPGGRLLERHLHARFAEHRIEGEWFVRAPQILAFIEQHAEVADR